LKTAGYTSALVGKWHQFGLTPKDFGFDDYITFNGSGVYWSEGKNKGANYTENGETKELKKNVYLPDLMNDHLVKFLNDNKKKPFFLYYSMVHVHALIQRTPDSKPGSDLYADNTAYMDKLVGKLLTTLDDMKLRENTLIIFMGDNGTAINYAERGTIGGKALSGQKGTMLECGSLVPTIASWPSVIKAGQVNTDLIDSSDLLPTFAAVSGAPLPTKNILDGRSFLPQLQGKKGNPKEYIYMELGNKWYVRSAKWKLTRQGELFDMSNAPFEEKLVSDYANNAAANTAYTRLQAILKEIAPEKGILDDADGSGRHAGHVRKKNNAKKDKDSE
jgi:arylsulfatase A